MPFARPLLIACLLPLTVPARNPVAWWARTHDSAYFNYIRHTIDAEGILRGYKEEDLSLDNIKTGRSLLFLWQATGDTRYRQAADRHLDGAAATPILLNVKTLNKPSCASLKPPTPFCWST